MQLSIQITEETAAALWLNLWGEKTPALTPEELITAWLTNTAMTEAAEYYSNLAPGARAEAVAKLRVKEGRDS